MAEYLFASFIEKADPEEAIKGPLPLHLTLLHWFNTLRGPVEIERAITPVVANIGKITTQATKDDLFGPNLDVPVVRLERTNELLGLHLGLVAAIRPLGVEFDERWTGEHWNPHVTNTPDKKLQPGKPLEINQLSIVGRTKPGTPKVIIDTLEL